MKWTVVALFLLPFSRARIDLGSPLPWPLGSAISFQLDIPDIRPKDPIQRLPSFEEVNKDDMALGIRVRQNLLDSFRELFDGALQTHISDQIIPSVPDLLISSWFSGTSIFRMKDVHIKTAQFDVNQTAFSITDGGIIYEISDVNIVIDSNYTVGKGKPPSF